MPEINVTNSAGRDAVVNAESVTVGNPVRWLDGQERQALSVRILKSTIDRDLDALVEETGGLDQVGAALIAGDPEIDLESVGSFLRDPSRMFVDGNRQIVHKIRQWEVVRNPDGSQRERYPAWGHSSWLEACRVAQAAGAKNLALFHHDPEAGDADLERMLGLAREVFPRTFLAQEGLTVHLPLAAADVPVQL